LLLPYLADHPPTHILVAGFVGWQPRREQPQRPGRPPRDPTLPPDATPEAMAIAAGLGTGRDVHAGMGTVVLDFVKLRRAATDGALR
jgi:hypothetical protein